MVAVGSGCQLENGGCAHLCNFTSGLVCMLLLDVDECQNNNGRCEQRCNNTDGSFQCLCDGGYTLAADGFTCDGKGSISLCDIMSKIFTFF